MYVVVVAVVVLIVDIAVVAVVVVPVAGVVDGDGFVYVIGELVILLSFFII